MAQSHSEHENDGDWPLCRQGFARRTGAPSPISALQRKRPARRKTCQTATENEGLRGLSFHGRRNRFLQIPAPRRNATIAHAIDAKPPLRRQQSGDSSRRTSHRRQTAVGVGQTGPSRKVLPTLRKTRPFGGEGVGDARPEEARLEVRRTRTRANGGSAAEGHGP